MYRHALFSWIICTFALMTLLFQNCSKVQPQLEVSSGYSAGAESIGESNADEEAVIAEIIRGSTIEFSQSVPAYSNVWTPVFSFSINNPRVSAVVSYLCKIDGGDWATCSSPLKIEGLADDMHTLSVKASYKSDVFSIPQDVVWTKDSRAPLVGFNKTPPAYIGTGDVEITFSATDGGSGIGEYSCLFDSGDWQTCTSPINYTNLSNGPHSLKVRVADRAGNINEVSSMWTIDPSYSYISLTAKPEAFIKESKAEFSFEVMNGLTFNEFECQFSDAVSFSPCASGISYNLSADGLYIFRVRAKDPQGYYTSTLSYQFYRDTTAPTIQLVSPESGTISRNSLVIAANIDDGNLGSGVGHVTCRVQSLVNSESTNIVIPDCKFPLDLSSQLTGDYKLIITADDKLTNETVSEEFQFLYIKEEKKPAFLTLNLAGGAALMANVIPLNENSSFLDTYNRMGMGNKAYVEANNERYLGAIWYKNSGLMKGIKKHLSSDGASQARVYALPVASQDTTSNNPFDIQTYISSVGLRGTFIRAAANASGRMLNGIGQTTIFSGKGLLALDLTPVFKLFTGFLDLSNHSGYTTFAHFPMIENHDAYSNSDFVSIFGTDTNRSNNTAATKQIIYNAINGNIGPGGINISGFDYRDVSRSMADARDEIAGEWIGKAIQYAYVTKKKLMIYVPTDGSVESAPSNTGGGDWINDRGSAGQLLFFVIDPINGLAASNFGSDYMIGNFKSDQTANDDFFTPSDARVNARELAGLAVVANYLQLAGHRDRIESATQSIIKNDDAIKFIRVKNP